MKRWAVALAALAATGFAVYSWALARAVKTATLGQSREEVQILQRAERRRQTITDDEAKSEQELDSATLDQLIDRVRARALGGVRGPTAATGLGAGNL